LTVKVQVCNAKRFYIPNNDIDIDIALFYKYRIVIASKWKSDIEAALVLLLVLRG